MLCVLGSIIVYNYNFHCCIFILFKCINFFVTVEIENGDKPQVRRELHNVHSAYQLDGKNYLKWSQSAHVFVDPENKKGSIPQLNHEGLERVKSFLSNIKKPISIGSLTYSDKLPYFVRFNVSRYPFYQSLDFRL